MLVGSDYERPHSLGVNLETGTFARLPFFDLPKWGKKGKQIKGTDNFSLLPPSPQREKLLPAPHKPPSHRGDAVTMSTLKS